METFVGLDCGGTTSRVLAVDRRGDVVFRGQSGAANLLATPACTLERNLRRATAGCPPAAYVFGAFAGLVGPDERARALALLESVFPGAKIEAEPDYAAAHAAASEGTHLTVLAGTGSLVCGRDAEGRLVKTGGWGYLLGDYGSGYRYGHAALTRFLRTPQACSDVLRDAVASLFGSTEPSALISAVYGATAPQSVIARLLPAFAADLDAGETYAERDARREIDSLAEWVTLHVAKYPSGDRALRIALAGGVWKASLHFEAMLRKSLEKTFSDRPIALEKVVRPPVQGAVALAIGMKHGDRE